MKKLLKRKTILKIVVIVLIIVAVLFVVIFGANRLRGTIKITINGNKYKLDNIICYEGEDEQKVKYLVSADGLKFMNSGMKHNMYRYTFDIKDTDINISPVIRVFKINWWKLYKVNVEIEMYKDGEYWNANIKAEIDGSAYVESFEDIENNPINIRLE